MAVYFPTEPKPGEQSVRGRSLSTVFGIPIHLISNPFFKQYSEILLVVSWESPPPL
jgi:hypothetical protein